MPTLPPLHQNVTVHEYAGNFPLQLEIFDNSSLQPDEIEDILRLASWESDPNLRDDIYLEGGRSYVISGERAIQLGGVGYLPFDFDSYNDGTVLYNPGAEFQHPTTQNFMEGLPQKAMKTKFSEGGRIKGSRPTYRATGAYTRPELLEKVERTNLALTRKKDYFDVPELAGYGRYIGEEFTTDEGQLGFIVQAFSEKEIIRLHEYLSFHARFLREQSHSDAFLSFVDFLISGTRLIGKSARGIHQAGLAHLQLHLSNFYATERNLLVTDWATARELTDNPYDSTVNRLMDLAQPYRSLVGALAIEFPNEPREELVHQYRALYEALHEGYAGESVTFRDFFDSEWTPSFGTDRASVLLYGDYFAAIDAEPARSDLRSKKFKIRRQLSD